MERAAQYVYEIYKSNSFSKAAKKLYISQPSLSATVSKLENELGFKIFDRSTAPVSLTQRGQIYIEMLEEMIESEVNMQRKLRQLSDQSASVLTIGCHSITSHYISSIVCGRFREKYPNVNINVKIGNIGSFIGNFPVINKSIDLFFSFDYKQNDFEGVPIYEEQIVIAMNRNMQGARELEKYSISRDELISGSYPEEKKLSDLSIFNDIPFIEYHHLSTTLAILKKLIPNYKASKCIVVNSRTTDIHYHFMCEKAGALVTSDTLIKVSSHNDDDILYFVPESPTAKRKLYIAYKKNHKLSDVEKNFISVAIEACRDEKINS